MNTTTSVNEQKPQSTKAEPKRGRLFYVRRGLKWLGIVVVMFLIVGYAFQTIAGEVDKRNYPPRGQLYRVNGHLMHMVCMGEGSPVVVLQAGLSADSLWWYRVQTQLAQQTKVCAYDRPGLGWSEATSGSRDALSIVGELHMLLGQAGISAPYIVAGHSYGAIWTRIYAAQYPQEVAGIALIDSGLVIPAQFASQSEFEQWKTSSNGIQALLWGMYRIGLVRLTGSGDFNKWGYPAQIVPEMVALHSANQVFDTTYAEQISAMWSLAKASADAEDLGNLPMAVLWASETHTMMGLIPALREIHDEIPTYSSDSMTRIIEGADHGSILGKEQYAQQVTDSILDVIEAAHTGEPLT